MTHRLRDRGHFYRDHMPGVYSFLVSLNQMCLILLLLIHVPSLIVHDFIQIKIASFLFLTINQNDSEIQKKLLS